MKYLILFIFLVCAACEKPVDNIARNLDCEWVHRYKICICVGKYDGQGSGVGMTIAPDRVCNRIEMEPVEISPEKSTKDSL